MVGSRSVGATVLWLSLLFLMAAAVTGAAFLVFVAKPDRGTAFYISLSLVVGAELMFFSHLLHSRLARAQAPAASPATRLQVQGLIFVWFVITVIAAAVAAKPGRADTLAADRVLVTDAMLTFLFFAVAYGLYARGREVESVDAQLQEGRRRIQVNAEAVREVQEAVSQLARKHPSQAVAADQVGKKLDVVRTQLEAALVSERMADQPPAQLLAAVSRLGELANRARFARAEEAATLLQEIAAQSEAVLELARKRERALPV